MPNSNGNIKSTAFAVLFSIVRLRARCSRTSCTLRYACSPFAIFNACSAPDYFFVSNTLRFSSSSFLALAVCSLARHLFASKKAVFKTHNQAQLRLCFFLCQAVGKVLTYLCTFRALSSPSSTCAPCSAFGQRLARDNNSATHARLSRFSAFALRLLVSCCCQAVARCSRTFCTLRSSFSSFSALAVCSLASHLFASKKAVFKTYNKSTAICRAF